jgi:hypothetical protein
MTGPELNRLSGALRLMELHCQPKRGLWWLHHSKGDGPIHHCGHPEADYSAADRAPVPVIGFLNGGSS